jgi:hypothetical protein
MVRIAKVAIVEAKREAFSKRPPETVEEVVEVEKLPVIVEGGVSKLDIDRLERPIRLQVLVLEKRLLDAIRLVGHTQLAVGKILVEIQDILQPLKLFVLYLNHLPWLSTATAYRYISAFKRAQEISPAVVEQAIAAGVPLFGTTDDKPFGKLTEAVQAMPPAPRDEEGAKQWLSDLRAKQKELTPEREILHPMDKLARIIIGTYQRHEDADVPFEAWLNELIRKTKLLAKEAKVAT